MTVTRLKKFLLLLLVFLIPTNLSLHFPQDYSYIQGLLVDYLIPQIYAQDIVLLILVLIMLPSANLKAKSTHLKFLWIALVFAYLFTNSVTSIAPQNSLLFTMRIALYTLAASVLATSSPILTPKMLVRVIIITLTFQAIVAGHQFYRQQSLAGYLFFGEPALSQRNTVATASMFGSLRILPYGTTPHPNVLAGVFTIFTLVIISIYIYNPNLAHRKSTTLYSLGLSISFIMLTESISALLALSIGLLYIMTVSMHDIRLLSRLQLTSILVLGLILCLSIYQLTEVSDIRSITRRYTMLDVAFQVSLHHPAVGVGPGNYLYAAHRQASQTDRFLMTQPVHNIYLLYLAETGIFGFLCLLWFLYLLRIPKYVISPLVALLIIGLLDHYPYTLVQGQLLCLVILVYYTVGKETLPHT